MEQLVTEKIPIAVSSIRKGDTIRFEYEQSKVSGSFAGEYIALMDNMKWGDYGQHYLLNRPEPPVVLPTEPGWYVGFDKLAQRQLPVFVTKLGIITHPTNGSKISDPKRFAPFKRLRDESETAAEVLMSALCRYDSTYSKFKDVIRDIATEHGATL